MKTPEEAARKYAKKIWKNGRTYRSRIGYSAEDFLAGYTLCDSQSGRSPKMDQRRGMDAISKAEKAINKALGR